MCIIRSNFNATSPGHEIAMKAGANCLLTKGVQLCINCFGILANTGLMLCLHTGRLLQHTSYDNCCRLFAKHIIGFYTI